MNLPAVITATRPRGLPPGEEPPKLGEWRWVDWTGDDQVVHTELMCVARCASNHVVFEQASREHSGSSTLNLRYSELLARTRRAPEWREAIQSQIADCQRELQQCLIEMSETVRAVGLLPPDNSAPADPANMLPSVVRRSPAEAKEALQRLKAEQFPANQKKVEAITKHMVALHKDLTLPMRVEGRRMEQAVETVDDRLFVLELYAGLCETAIRIRRGEPAPATAPIAIRQMLRYMDEETLIDYDTGGLDFAKLQDFDRWVAKDENLNRVCPEPRSVVAFKVRRHKKDYGVPDDIAHAFAMAEWNKKNEATYLLLRNGKSVWRLATDINFAPRLLPLREEFIADFEVDDGYDRESHSYKQRKVTPDDFDYDDMVEKRKQTAFKYNRAMFLLQGLLDRSEVFHPHPPINLGDPSQLEEHVRLVYDEEDGLPNADPPKWEEFRDKANATIRKDSLVWCGELLEVREFSNWRGNWTRPKYGHDAPRRPTICRVWRVSKDRKTVVLRWSLGDRIKERWVLDYSRPVPNKPNWYYRKMLTDNFGERFGHQRVPIESCFAVEAYTPGDYKRFLCDAYLKGAYLKWAPQLLSAERWHREKNGQEEAK